MTKAPPKEGSTEAPIRHDIPWRDEGWTDMAAIEKELERVFDICHGCRRCFNLCDSFPRLFDMVDESDSGELDSVPKERYAEVEEACTLCDLCFMTKCPYVPPHEFDLDFPHLMLRYRAARAKEGHTNFTQGQLAQMDRNGRLAGAIAPIANWGSSKKNTLSRSVLESTAGIDAKAELPKFHGRTFVSASRKEDLSPNPHAPAFGRKVAIYATCFVNYNNPGIGMAARRVLAHNGVDTRVDYPGCCGMPYLEQAKMEKVAAQAEKVADFFSPLIDDGYKIITLTASCGLMLKFEWPLILPENPKVKKLSEAVMDIDQYMVDIAKTEGLADGLKPVPGGVSVHLAYHARAQNVGPKAVEMLKFIPEADIDIIERCSGHGGTFGIMKDTHEIALKVGTNTFRAALRGSKKHIVSDCPLAGKHIIQGMNNMADNGQQVPDEAQHPIEIMALSYGLTDTAS